MAKIEKKNSQLKKTNSKFGNNFLLRGRAILPLLFEPIHNYLGPAVTEWFYEPVGLICAGFSAVGPTPKIENFTLTKCSYFFQFYIRIPNFRPPGSIIKKKYLKVVDPLKPTKLTNKLTKPPKLTNVSVLCKYIRGLVR